MRKGFVLDDDRLKNLGGGGYFKELLERIRDIRDIRASEKVFYPMRRKTPCFSYGDIRRDHRIYASN